MSNKLPFLLVPALILPGCSSFSSDAKLKYVERGNQYFDQGKLKEASIMYRKAIEKDKRYGEAYYRLAMTDMRQGQPAEAVRNLHRAVEFEPKHPKANGQLFDLYLVFYSVSPRFRTQYETELRAISKRLTAQDPNSFDAVRSAGFIALLDKKQPEAEQLFNKALQLRPDSFDTAVALVKAKLDQKKLAEAEEFCRQYVAAHPKALAVYDLQIALVRQRGDVATEEKLLKEKLEKNSDDPRLYLQLAGWYLSKQRKQESEATLDRLRNDAKRFPDGRMQVGEFYLAARDNAAAEREFQTGLASSAKEKRAGYQLRLAQSRLSQGKGGEAESIIDQILNENRDNFEASAAKASFQIQSGQPEKVKQAIERLQALITKRPDNVEIRHELGKAYMASNQSDQALTAFEEALKVSQGHVPSRLAMAQIYESRQQWAQALQASNEMLNISDGRYLPGRIIHANALMQLGDLKQARAETDALLAAAPQLPDVQHLQAVLSMREGKPKEAEAALAKLPPTDPRGQRAQLELLAAQGRWDEIRKIAQSALDKNPNNLPARMMLADVALQTKQVPAALEQYQQVISTNPKAPQMALVYNKVGNIYALQGDLNKAVESYEKGRELDKSDVGALLRLAQVYQRMGQKDRALAAYRDVLTQQSDQPEALNNLAYDMAENGQDLDLALTYAQKARQKMPDNPDVQDTVAYVMIKKNLPDTALPILKELLAKYPDNATYQLHYVMALAQRADKGEAKRAATTALQRKLNNEADKNRLRELLAKLG